jgi:hypothetical protein
MAQKIFGDHSKEKRRRNGLEFQPNLFITQTKTTVNLLRDKYGGHFRRCPLALRYLSVNASSLHLF